MRLQVLIAGALLAGVALASVLWPRSAAPDAVVARDRLAAGDLVVTFRAAGVEGYRFTRVHGLGWSWERISPSGHPYPDVILSDGVDYLLAIGEACYVPLPRVRLPLMPGVSVTPSLARQPGLERVREGVYRYTTWSGETLPVRASEPEIRVTVVEDLREVGAAAVYTATTSSDSADLLPGTYTVASATAEDRVRLERLIAAAAPSDVARLGVREKVVGSSIGNILLGPYTMLVAGDCPDRPVLLRPAAEGGQVAGPRYSLPNMRLERGAGAVVVKDAIPLPFSIRHIDYALFHSRDWEAPGDVVLRPGVSFVSTLNGQGIIAQEVTYCDPRPFFPC